MSYLPCRLSTIYAFECSERYLQKRCIERLLNRLKIGLELNLNFKRFVFEVVAQRFHIDCLPTVRHCQKNCRNSASVINIQTSLIESHSLSALMTQKQVNIHLIVTLINLESVTLIDELFRRFYTSRIALEISVLASFVAFSN